MGCCSSWLDLLSLLGAAGLAGLLGYFLRNRIVQALQGEVEEKDKNLSTYRTDVHTTNEKAKRLEVSLNESSAKYAKLSDDHNGLILFRDNLQKDYDQYKVQSTSRLKSVEDELAMWKNRYNEIEGKWNTSVSKATSLEKDLADANGRYANLKGDYDKYVFNFTNLNKDKDGVNLAFANFKADSEKKDADWSFRYKNLAKEKDDLQAELNTVKQDLAGERNRYTIILGERDKLAKEKSDLHLSFGNAQSDIEGEKNRYTLLFNNYNEAEGKIKDLEAQIANYNIQINNLNADLEGERNRYIILMGERDKLMQDKNDLHLTFGNAQSDLEGERNRYMLVLNNYNEAEAKCKDLEGQIANFNIQINKLNGELEGERNRYIILRGEKDKLAEEKDNLNLTFGSAQSDLEGERNRYTLLFNNYNEAEGKIKDLEGQIANFNLQINNLNQELESERNRYTLIFNNYNEAEAKCKDLEGQMSNLNLQINNMNLTFGSAQSDLEGERNRYMILFNLYNETKSRALELEGQIANYNIYIERERNRYMILMQEREQLVQEKEKMMMTFGSSQTDLEGERNRYSMLMLNFNKAESRAQELEGQISSLSLQLKNQNAELADERNRYSALFTTFNENKARLLTLEGQMSNLKLDLESERKRYMIVVGERDRLVGEKDNLSISAGSSSSDLENERNKYNALYANYMQIESKYKTLELQFEQLNTRLSADKSSQSRDWETRYNSALRQVSDAEFKINNLESERADLQLRIRSLESTKSEGMATWEMRYNEIRSQLSEWKARFETEERERLRLSALLKELQEGNASNAEWSSKLKDYESLISDLESELAKFKVSGSGGASMSVMMEGISSVSKVSKDADNLEIIEGIGPKIAQLLNGAGIYTFRQLSKTSVERLRTILTEAGSRYKMHDPSTWSRQAEMAADGKWDELKAWQLELNGGSEMSSSAEGDSADIAAIFGLGGGAAHEMDDLEIVEGIGPKIAQLLNGAGIYTFKQLANTSFDKLRAILDAAGSRYKMHDPSTWSRQAEMAANGKWEELKAWQLELNGGAVVSNEADDLEVIEGIGPKIEQLLNDAGIRTFKQLSKTPVEKLRAILTEAGSRFKMHDPSTWAQQADLAANGKWDELKTLQDELNGGRK